MVEEALEFTTEGDKRDVEARIGEGRLYMYHTTALSYVVLTFYRSQLYNNTRGHPHGDFM